MTTTPAAAADVVQRTRPLPVSQPPPPAPPTLRAAVGRRTLEMELTDLRVDVRAAGLVAETTLVLTFRNPHPRELEGDLLVPLPDGATICGFGLDVDGELVDASLVERHRAREVFEQEVRRPKIIDPGLAEHVRGNVFRTRVYPLPARGRRQVKLQYVSDLAVTDGRAVLDVPLPSTGELNRLDVRVEVARAAGHPVAEGDDWGGAAFKPVGDNFVADLHRRHTRPTRLRILLPDVPRSVAVTQTGPDDRRYFAVHHLSSELVGDDLPVRPGQPLRLAWDASLSRATTDKQREFDTLGEFLRRLGDVEIDLVVFHRRAEPARRFSIEAGDAHDLLHHLAHLVYDGATTLEALSMATATTDSNPPAYTLLFSEALITLGPTSPDTIAPTTPVFTLTAAPHADHNLLRRVASASGGAFLNLSRLSPESAADRAGRVPRSLLSVDVLAGSVEELLPATPCPLDEAFTLTGRLTGDRATLRLNFGHGTIVTDSVTCEIGGDATSPGRVIPRLWAQQKAATLSPAMPAGRAALLDLGRSFGLVTPGTSLLVLETLWQHLDHRVEPAPTRTRLYRAYHQSLASRDHNPRAARIDTHHAERLEIIRFYARLRLGEDVDPTWLADQTEGRTAAEVVQMIDDAAFMARSRGHAKIDLNDLLSASPLLRSRTSVAPARHHWLTRLAWHRRTFTPPDHPVRTVLPYNPWLASNTDAMLATTRFRSGTSREFTIDKTLDRSIDRSIDIGALDATAATPRSAAEWAAEPPRPPTVDPISLPSVTDESDAHAHYLRQRPGHVADPSFYAAWADLFLARGWRDAGLRILSNLAELATDDAPNLRALAYALEAAGEDILARGAYEQILAARPEEPQSFRDLALVLERLGEVQRAADLLVAVVSGDWDPRFAGIQATALTELSALLVRHRRRHPDAPPLRVDLDQDLSHPFDLDLRVTLDWNTDLTNLDLWLLEPTGQLAATSVPADTKIGGHVPHDMTAGHGPEEYLLRRAVPGRYRASVQFVADARRRLPTPTTAKVTILRNFARPDEHRQVVLLRTSHRPLPTYAADGAGSVGCLVSVVGVFLTILGTDKMNVLGTWFWTLGPLLWTLAIGWSLWLRRVRRRHQQQVNVHPVAEVDIPA